MSTEAVHGFIAKVERDTELGAIVTQALTTNSDIDFVDLASKHGFAFTREEGLKVWDEFLSRGELPDALLETVAGGSPVDCSQRSNQV